MKRVKKMEKGKYYLVYGTRMLSEPVKSIHIWKYLGLDTSESPEFGAETGLTYSSIIRGHTSHVTPNIYFKDQEQVRETGIIPAYLSCLYFELDQDEFEKHILIYGI